VQLLLAQCVVQLGALTVFASGHSLGIIVGRLFTFTSSQLVSKRPTHFPAPKHP
jgi:hypothetical protein